MQADCGRNKKFRGKLCAEAETWICVYVPVGVAVDARWGTVSGPASVCNTNVCVEHLCEVGLLGLDELLELCDLANLLESENLVPLVSVDCQTS